MRSSAATGIRALIMLACLVGVPVLATSGTSWSDMLKKLQQFRLPALLNPVEASSPSTSQAANSSGHPLSSVQQASAAGNVASAGSLPNYNPLSNAVRPSNSGKDMPNLGESRGTFPLRPPTAASASSPPPGLGFREIQARLQELGATYYLLETWGSEKLLFRFYCRMAVGGNPDHTYYFEAVNSDPLQAMQEVLQRVEQWRGGSGKIAGFSHSAGYTLSRPY